MRQKSREPKIEVKKDDTPQQEEKIDLGFQVDPNKVYIFETIKKSENPRNENLGSTARVYDTVEKRYREIRYHPTTSSIFTEDQDEYYDDIPLPPLGFYRNVLYMNGQDIRGMEYVMCHPLYEHSPYKIVNRPPMYTLADKDVRDAIKAKQLSTELKALQVIKDMHIDDLKPIARIMFGITETSDVAILNALSELVKKPKVGSEKQSNADKVLDNLSNPRLVRRYKIQSWLDKGVISADKSKGECRQIDGNIFVCRLESRDSLEDILEHSLTKEGKEWYDTLKSKI